ncbi:MAG: protein SanA [Flavobacteriales bacterium]|nr:MAG: protein SanA [Flavobacteriales bacterium]
MKKRIFFIGLILICIFLVLLFIPNFLINKFAQDKTFSSPEDIKYNKVGLILGTSNKLTDGSKNLFYQYRIDAAVNLYNSSKISYILVSGDNSTPYYNEPVTIKKDLVARGIPKDKIFLDYAGFRTLDSVVRAREIFGQNAITIISQKFHNQRAIYIADIFGIQAVGFNAKDVDLEAGIKVRIREYFARTKVFLDWAFGVEPKFFGEPIKIE